MSETTTDEKWPGQRVTLLALARAARECSGDEPPEWASFVAIDTKQMHYDGDDFEQALKDATPEHPDHGDEWDPDVLNCVVELRVPVMVAHETYRKHTPCGEFDAEGNYVIVEWHDHERHETAHRWKCPCCEETRDGAISDEQFNGMEERYRNLSADDDPNGPCPVCGLKETTGAGNV